METTADGETMIDFPDIEEGQPIPLEAVGTVDGAPAEGEYVMPSGNTFVFVSGVLTEIKEAAAEGEGDDDDLDMKAFLEDLTKQLSISQEETATAKKELATAKKEKETLVAQVATIKNKQDEFQKELRTKFDFTAKKEGKKEDGKDEVKSDAKNALQTIRNKRKNK